MCRWRKVEGLCLVHHANALLPLEIRKDALHPLSHWHKARDMMHACRRCERLPYDTIPETHSFSVKSCEGQPARCVYASTWLS